MVGMLDLFRTVILVQLFFSFAITGFAYVLPSDSLDYVAPFSGVGGEINLSSVSGDVEASLERQTSIPVVDVGALVFYSGNIILDLILNFAFAIPEMFGLVVNGFTLLFNLDGYVVALVEMFFGVVVMALYMIGLMQLLLGVRSGRAVV